MAQMHPLRGVVIHERSPPLLRGFVPLGCVTLNSGRECGMRSVPLYVYCVTHRSHCTARFRLDPERAPRPTFVWTGVRLHFSSTGLRKD